MPCPISWFPGALTPSSHGVLGFQTSDGAPCPLRMFYPGHRHSAVEPPQVLRDCGRFPLILFVHGHCHGDLDEHYRKWVFLPTQLARSGYVVVVPQRGNAAGHPAIENHSDLALMTNVVEWARTQWEHHEVLVPSSTGICGHSWGALLGARLAATGFDAFASLSGGWQEWGNPPLPIDRLRIPMLFISGGASDSSANLAENVWDALSIPRHQAAFANGLHWDYLPPETTPCDLERGPCSFVAAATADLVTMFFAKYMPPEELSGLPNQIPDNLRPPDLNLTPEQKPFAVGHLDGWRQLTEDSDCKVTLRKKTGNERVVPHVRFRPVAEAISVILQVGLKPHVIGPELNAFVVMQSPVDGEIVSVGDVITLRTQEGRTP